MAIAFVQSKSTVGVGNVPVTFTSDNTAGNFIIVAVAANTGSGSFTMSDTQANSYFTVVPFASSSTYNGQIYFAKNVKAGPNTVTFFPGAAVSSLIAVHEFSGLDTVDQVATAAGAGAAQDSTGATTTKNNELLFGFTMGTDSGVSAITNGVGFTLAESSLAAGTVFLTQWQIVAAIGTYNSTTTVTLGKGGSYSWGAEIETFFNSVVPKIASFIIEF